MPPRNLGNRNPGSEPLGDDPPLLLHRPAPAASYPGANVHPPARELRVAYSVAHMCETFPPNQQEDCNIPRASIKVGWENRLLLTGTPVTASIWLFIIVFAPSLWNATAAAEAEANLWDINIAGSPELPGAGISS